jgi:hypothetical protein
MDAHGKTLISLKMSQGRRRSAGAGSAGISREIVADRGSFYVLLAMKEKKPKTGIQMIEKTTRMAPSQTLLSLR